MIELDLEQLKKRRDELNEMIAKIEEKKEVKDLEKFLGSRQDLELNISVPLDEDYSSFKTFYVKSKYIKILVD